MTMPELRTVTLEYEGTTLTMPCKVWNESDGEDGEVMCFEYDEITATGNISMLLPPVLHQDLTRLAERKLEAMREQERKERATDAAEDRYMERMAA